MEIAVYGGTFNPPTIAHEAVIEACLARPDIDEVWVMPSGERADKQWETTNEQRLAMLGVLKQARFGGSDRLHINTYEMEAPFATETWATVLALEKQYPNDTFHFVFGGDSYLDMPNWRFGRALQQYVKVLLVPRDGYEVPPENDYVAHMPVMVPGSGVSSTRARLALAEGRAPEGVVHPEVTRFILQRGLYRCDTIR